MYDLIRKPVGLSNPVSMYMYMAIQRDRKGVPCLPNMVIVGLSTLDYADVCS